MTAIKTFSRAVRQELGRIAMTIKQMEFKVLRLRSVVKKRLREEIQELKRMKDAIMHRLSELTAEAMLHLPTMQSIREDIALLHDRCRQCKSQYW